MKTSRIVIISLALFLAQRAIAMAIPLPAVEYGRQTAADDVAEARYESGRWHVSAPLNDLGLASDAGFFAPGYALFDLASITEPVADTSLSFQVIWRIDANHDYPYPLALYDVNDLDALRPPPNWQSSMSLSDYMASFLAVKNDLISGETYGTFSIPPFAEGMTMEVALSSAGIAAINASLGGSLAMSLGPGKVDGPDGVPSEGAYILLENVVLDVAPGPATGPVSEPATLLLMGIGLSMAGMFRPKKKRLMPS
jgi:hypothetical protein